MASLPTRWGEFFFFALVWSKAFSNGNIFLRDSPLGSISCRYAHGSTDAVSNLYLSVSLSLFGDSFTPYLLTNATMF